MTAGAGRLHCVINWSAKPRCDCRCRLYVSLDASPPADTSPPAVRLRPSSVMWASFLALGAGSATIAASATTTSKTMVVVLADDVDDTLLPLMRVMPNTQRMVQAEGMTFSNSFVTTPVCCPSRSSIMSGLYQHNTKCVRNSISGGCSSAWWQQNIEKNRTFAVHLRNAGWRTFYGGKYLNTCKC